MSHKTCCRKQYFRDSDNCGDELVSGCIEQPLAALLKAAWLHEQANAYEITYRTSHSLCQWHYTVAYNPLDHWPVLVLWMASVPGYTPNRLI